jgi:hypothetical protein
MERLPGWLRDLKAAVTRRQLSLLGTVLFAVLLLAALSTIGIEEILAELSSADPALLGGAVVVYAASWPLRGRRYRDILDAMGSRCETGLLTAAVFVSQTANLVVPARAGDAGRAYLLKRVRSVPYTSGAASLAVERVFDLLAITLLAGGALGWLVLTGELSLTVESTTPPPGSGTKSASAGASGTGLPARRTVMGAAAGVAGLALAGSVCAVVVARTDSRPAQVLSSRIDHPLLERVLAPLLEVGAHVRVVARSSRTLLLVGSASLLIWTLDVVTAVLVLAALGGGLAPWSLLVVGTLAVSVGNLAKVLPLSQGGIGLYEAAFTALVVGLTGLAPELALAAAVLDHALKNLVTIAGGAGSAAVWNLSPWTVAGDQ